MAVLRCWAMAGLSWLVLGACSESSEAPSSGGGGAPPGPSAPVCDQTCQDYLVSLALVDTLTLVYNENLAGKPVGAQDFTAPCPLGGSVHVTGTNGYAPDTEITTFDLRFELQECAASDSLYRLTFNGSVRELGSSGGQTAITFASSSLAVTGALEMFDDPEVDESYPLSVTLEGSGDDQSLDGQVDGRVFSSETAFSGAFGGSGAGGTGSSATGGAGGGTTPIGGPGCPSRYDGSYFGQFAFTTETGDPPVSTAQAFQLTVELECLASTSEAVSLIVTRATASHPYFECGVGACTPRTGSVALLPAEPPTNSAQPSASGHGLVIYFPNGTVLATENTPAALNVTTDGGVLSSSLASRSAWSAANVAPATVFPGDGTTVTAFDSWKLTQSTLP